MFTESVEDNILTKEKSEEITKSINRFTRNLKQYINIIKKDNIIKNKNIPDKEEEEEKEKEQFKDNKIIKTNTNTNNDNIYILSSLAEFDLLNSFPVSPEITQPCLNQKTKASEKMTPSKKNNSHFFLSSNREQMITSLIQTTSSLNIQNLKKKYLNPKNRRNKFNKKPKNLKKVYSQNNFYDFYERVKEEQKKKEMHIKNLSSQSLEIEMSEMQVHTSMDKNSIKLLKKSNSRKPLYQKEPLNKEKNISKTFKNFYDNVLKHNMTFSLTNKRITKNDYNKFYEDKIKWKKNIEEKIKNQKLNNDKKYKEYIDNIPFKPSINQNSINIVNKICKNRSAEKNIFYDSENDENIINKFKAKMKPLIYNINNNNNYKNALYKKSHVFKRTLSEINLHDMNNSNNNCKNYKNKNNKSRIKINYKLNEKKYEKLKNNDINKKNETKEKSIQSQNKLDFYKLNVRPGSAWNYNVINNITNLSKYNNFIEGLL